jgi:hypothetical protein
MQAALQYQKRNSPPFTPTPHPTLLGHHITNVITASKLPLAANPMAIKDSAKFKQVESCLSSPTFKLAPFVP